MSHTDTKTTINDLKEIVKQFSEARSWTQFHSPKTLTQAEENPFKNFAELKQVFSSVDKVGKFHVFDVGGNKLRVITAIHFNRGKVYLRAVITHKEYDQGYWSKL